MTSPFSHQIKIKTLALEMRMTLLHLVAAHQGQAPDLTPIQTILHQMTNKEYQMSHHQCLEKEVPQETILHLHLVEEEEVVDVEEHLVSH